MSRRVQELEQEAQDIFLEALADHHLDAAEYRLTFPPGATDDCTVLIRRDSDNKRWTLDELDDYLLTSTDH